MFHFQLAWKLIDYDLMQYEKEFNYLAQRVAEGKQKHWTVPHQTRYLNGQVWV